MESKPVNLGIGYYRNLAGVPQVRMAELMGMPLRTYEDIEAGRSTLRPIHLVAAEMALLLTFAQTGDVNVLHPNLQQTAERIAMAWAASKETAS